MKKIPFLDLASLHASMEGEIRAAIDAVIAHGRFINGPEVKAFENDWAVYTGSKGCVAASNGTTALHAIFACLGIGPGDEVILPSHTFVATAESIRMTGATPVFADIDPETWTLDPAGIPRLLSNRTRAIVPVHIYGAPADMDAINAIAREHGIVTVEDAAQAHGATLNGRMAGTLGRAAAFSFFPGKNLGAFGDAGAITTIDEELAHSTRLYVNHGREGKYEHLAMGTNYRCDTLQAAILAAKLPHLKHWTERRRALAAVYRRRLSAEPFASKVQFQKLLPGSESAYHLFVIHVPDREKTTADLNAKGIGTGVHYPIPCHLQPSMMDFGRGPGSLPVTERLCEGIISLPMCPTLNESDIEFVCDALCESLEKGA